MGGDNPLGFILPQFSPKMSSNEGGWDEWDEDEVRVTISAALHTPWMVSRACGPADKARQTAY